MAFDAYRQFLLKRRALRANFYDDKPISSFPTDTPKATVPSIPSAILTGILTADRLKKISDQLINGTAVASDFFDFPVFPNAPPPSILYGDNEGVPAVITPTPPTPIPVFRPPPSQVVVRPPVRTWPPPECCY